MAFFLTSNPPHISNGKLSREPSDRSGNEVTSEVWAAALIVWEVK